ncbi:hypothetical protein PHLCEN_2v5446 [Hermanssonia centrifuga]|uniref:NADP-dependent oxidoreductase domain-containing protein n=1 Tax=Hermanssonia centrifuga TaxID=98765 RepID=A0A2R6P2F4_9APHY|nr:hypothetical protein PHLCEN_2v5446 [Hermanssonia centrifuga]
MQGQNCVLRPIKPSRNIGKLGKFAVSEYPTSSSPPRWGGVDATANIYLQISGVKHLEEIREAGMETPAINQIELHPFCQQKPIVEYCRKHDIVVEAYCPLIRGKMDHPVLKEVAQKSATPARIHSNTKVYDFELDEDDMKRLDALDQGKEGAISWNPVDVP